MSSGEQSLWKLTGKLLERTRDGKLRWVRTMDKECFRTNFPKYAIQVRPVSLLRSEPDFRSGTPESYDVSEEAFRLEVLDSRSDIIDQYECKAYEGSALKDLYFEARRRATGAGEIVDELISVLDEAV